MAESDLESVVVVLVEPQDQVNIAATVRAMKNMGVSSLRLVRPCDYETGRMLTVAHDTREILERIQHFDSLNDAIADCIFAVGFTARKRSAKRELLHPREAASRSLQHAADGRVALVFGREDRGMSNVDLDRTNVVVTIPTTGYASLNLAQAVLIALYELHLAAEDVSRELGPPRKDAPPASSEQFEQLFADAERALEAIDFFKTRYPEHVMRTVRTLTFRAAPDAREIMLIRAMAIEVLRTLERVRRAREH